MKTLKKISFILIACIIISSVAGYLYFDSKFSPPANHLSIHGVGDTIPITWKENSSSPMAALLLPVSLEGIPEKFYMQFDLGSHSTLFYRTPLESISSRYPGKINSADSSSGTTSLSFDLGKLKISSETFRVLDYGSPVEWDENASVNIIGTLGADLLEKKITILNLKNNYCYFGDTVPAGYRFEMGDFKFTKRKVLIPAEIRGKKYELLYDTGTSAFELVTSKAIWNKLRKPEAEVYRSGANSVGRTLTTYTTESNDSIFFSSEKVKLHEVTYIEGTSFVQYWMMRLSGMGGMIGNKLFKDRVILLDAENGKFGIN